MAIQKGGAGISPPCEICGSSFTTVLAKREPADYNSGHVYRRRECLECGGRFTTWEIGKESYEVVKQNQLARRRAIKLAQSLINGEGLDRFKNLAIIDRTNNAAEKWNNPDYVEALEYGALLGLATVFGLGREEIRNN